MLCRPLGSVTLVCLALILLAAWDSRAIAQTGLGYGGGTGGTGGSTSAPGGGFTGGGASPGGGFTGGGASPGGGFTGGGASAGGGLTGGGSSATGGGTSLIGGLGGTSTGAGGTSTTPSAVNPFLSTYVNPYGAGLISVTGQQTVNKPFGQAMYSVYSTATQSTTTTSNNQGYGFNTVGMGRTPYYTATLSEDVPRVVHSNPELRSAVTDVVSRFTSVQATTPLQVRVDNATVYLNGTVATPGRSGSSRIRFGSRPGCATWSTTSRFPRASPRPRPRRRRWARRAIGT